MPTSKGKKEIKTDLERPDLVNGEFKPINLDEIYSTDVTHVALLGNRKSKTSVVIDIKISYNQGCALTYPNIEVALRSRGSGRDLIIQSDHGSEYVSKSYEKLARKFNFSISMSPKGVSVKNRSSEFLFRIIKNCYFNNPYTVFKKVYEMNLGNLWSESSIIIIT